MVTGSAKVQISSEQFELLRSQPQFLAPSQYVNNNNIDGGSTTFLGQHSNFPA